MVWWWLTPGLLRQDDCSVRWSQSKASLMSLVLTLDRAVAVTLQAMYDK
jgi:hypothetical protein